MLDKDRPTLAAYLGLLTEVNLLAVPASRPFTFGQGLNHLVWALHTVTSQRSGRLTTWERYHQLEGSTAGQ